MAARARTDTKNRSNHRVEAPEAPEGGVNRRGILLALGRRGESHKAIVARFQDSWTSSRGPGIGGKRRPAIPGNGRAVCSAQGE